MVFVLIWEADLIVRVMVLPGLLMRGQICRIMQRVKIPIRENAVPKGEAAERLLIRVPEIRLLEFFAEFCGLNSFGRLYVDVEMLFLAAFIILWGMANEFPVVYLVRLCEGFQGITEKLFSVP